MVQYVFNQEGVDTLNIAALSEFQTMDSIQVNNCEFRVLVDNAIQRTVVLPPIASLPVRNVIFTIANIGDEDAREPVYVIPTDGSGDKINGNPSININASGNCLRIEPIYDHRYVTPNHINML